MKKVVVALCSVIVIFASNMLMPMSVLAEEHACNHEYSIEIQGTYNGSYTHPYLIENGSQGPVYGTCYVTYTCDCIYLECHLCGHVDYGHPLNCHNYRNYVHSNCGQ